MMQPRDAHHHDDAGDCATTMPGERSHQHGDATMTGTTGTADLALVGARKRKALRVVKHQASPIKVDADEMGSSKGNTSLDTGVSSDLSESRRSLAEEELDDEMLLEDEESNESGGEFESERGGRKRARAAADDDDGCRHPIAGVKQQQQQQRHDAASPPLRHHLKCPECVESFATRAHLIQHVQMAHPATLAYHAAVAAAAGKDLAAADVPSILHLANAAALAAAAAAAAANPSGRPVNSMYERDVTNAPADEYKNEEDDPFSAVLREMKIKGEFPCRLCEAVFPNLRALKGHNRNHLTHAPYRCNMCPSTSQDKGALIRHMRTHNGERPYECRDCQYAFTTKANCERHLRNRHGKVGREAVRASIIYHLSEDTQHRAPSSDGNHNDSVLDLSADGPDSSRKTEDEDLTDYPSEDENEQDGPLDLTVDVLDLRKRRQEALPAVQPAEAKPNNVFQSYFGAAYPGLPFFYPGLGGASYSAFLESKLAEMNPPVDLSALALAAVHHDALRQVQKPPQPTPPPPVRPPMEGLLVPVLKKFATEPVPQPIAPIKVEKKPAPSVAAAAALEPGVKMVLKNGVLVKKQKQRRYRTERPFGCEHCTARFTLRSNMERHIKQQHPDIWSTRPRGHRRSACSLPVKAPTLPTMVDMKSHVPAVATPPQPETMSKEKAPISEQVRQAVQLKLKKRHNSEHSDDDEDEEDEDEEDESALIIDEPKETVKSEAPADLASVSKLLNNAVAQSFQQYFNQHREEHDDNSSAADKHHARSPSEGNTDEMDEGECTSISDGQSGGSDFCGNAPDGAKGNKKKSAYSNAPHRVSCPYCSRKFPWTSSLRRHILTHTGQKPFKCPQCPLWFTTKSNCDRHLLRKHGNVIHGHAAAAAAAVPERFKCALCPSLVFSSAENLKKHVDAKHCPGSPDSMGDEEKASRPASPSADSAEQLPYKCHLCDDHNGFAERQEVLDHLQVEHTEEFHDLVGKVGALVAEPPPASNNTSDEGEDYDSVRGKFPDYANRKVICAFCLRRFWSAEDLRRHMRTHSGERPYQCEVCSRRFTLKHSMLRHRRKHGGVSQADESEEVSEDEEDESGSERRRRNRRPTPPDAAANNKAKVRMQAFLNSQNQRANPLKLRGPCGSDLIGNLLGIQDTTLVEQLMSKPADDAARLLGVTGNRV